MDSLKRYIKDNTIWAFNINGLLEIQAVSQAANEFHKPIIMLVSENAIKFAGLDYLTEMVRITKKSTSVPIYIQLDHGKDMNLILDCARRNFDIIMVDASQMSYKENVKYVKKTSNLVKKINKNIIIEAELGGIANPSEKKIVNIESATDPAAV